MTAVCTDFGAPPEAILMDSGTRPQVPRLLGFSLLAGIGLNLLNHGQPWGLGVAISGVLITLLWFMFARTLSHPVSHSARFLMLLLLFFSAMVAYRASGILLVFNLSACLGLILLTSAVLLHGGLARSTLSDLLGSTGWSAVQAIAQPFVYLGESSSREAPEATRGSYWPVVRGTLFAVPPLMIFTMLFSAADAVFEHYLRWIFDIDLSELCSHLYWSGGLTIVALGLLRRAALARPIGVSDLESERLRHSGFDGRVEATVVLSLLNVLFLSFIWVQAAYLFGGADTIGRVQLSYSEYARRGFFELVAVATLVTVLILWLDWLIQTHRGVRAGHVDVLHVALLLQTLVIVASAVQRMRLYVEEYGLTELRLYTLIFMAWMALLLVWVAVTVLRGRRHRFGIGALVSGAVLMGAVNLADPDAFIARINITRETAGGVRRLDVDYLVRGLSPDAVPEIVARLRSIPDSNLRAEIAAALLTRLDSLRRHQALDDWRGHNRGRDRARRCLEEAQLELKRISRGG